MKHRRAMKNAILTTAAAILMMTFTVINANAQVTATGHISAEVVDGISASISSSSSVSSNNSITPATFSVSSTQATTFAVTIHETQTTITKVDGNDTLTMGNWTSTSDRNDLFASAQKVSLGATLNAGSSLTPTGVYTGSYKVTFDYN